MTDTFNLTEIEKEVVILTATYGLINGTVNYEVLDFRGVQQQIKMGEQVEVGFKSSTHFNFFSIMLVDILAKPDSRTFGLTDSYLGNLQKIAATPHLHHATSAMNLKKSVNLFLDWLEDKALYEKAWFPSIDLETDLSVKRIDLIVTCGNISKHNFTRLTKVAKNIQRIFEENGHSLTLHQSINVIEEFQEQFHINVLNYHSTSIACFLSEVLWGIHEYLLPVYSTSLENLGGDPMAYKYIYPSGINNEFAQECFWDLMNKVRIEPYVPRFTVPWYLMKRY